MKIGLFSDSHGDVKNLKQAADYLVKEAKTDYLVHLGDDYDDAKILEKYGLPFIKIPGVFSSYYKDPKIENRVIKDFDGTKILISHTDKVHANDLPDDLDPEEVVSAKLVKAVFYGHTHIPLVDERNGVLFVNPGHLKDEDKRGFLPSFAIVEIKDDEIEATVLSLKDKSKMVSGKLFSSTV